MARILERGITLVQEYDFEDLLYFYFDCLLILPVLNAE